ncbi:hypothetical protein PRZ48_013245 [Zasmidium cellare]|uniref:J domain-containing protein n=1 Tax=Zasmidium cellare TaxID=395010 RepID=A0ABR0E3I2_ZASCE|nr:hypothetical protein PRZ48_013245 [Zasmidium cellare]
MDDNNKYENSTHPTGQEEEHASKVDHYHAEKQARQQILSLLQEEWRKLKDEHNRLAIRSLRLLIDRMRLRKEQAEAAPKTRASSWMWLVGSASMRESVEREQEIEQSGREGQEVRKLQRELEAKMDVVRKQLEDEKAMLAKYEPPGSPRTTLGYEEIGRWRGGEVSEWKTPGEGERRSRSSGGYRKPVCGMIAMPPSEITDDYYAVFGLPQTASIEEIKDRYRLLTRQRHPDKNGGTPEATAAFQLLNNANETLRDAQKRDHYDKCIWPKVKRTNTTSSSSTAGATDGAVNGTEDSEAEDDIDEEEVQRQRLANLYQKLERLCTERSSVSEAMNKLKKEIEGLQQQNEGTERDLEYLHRQAAIRFREAKLDPRRKEFEKLAKDIGMVEEEIQTQSDRLDELEKETRARKAREKKAREEKGREEKAREEKAREEKAHEEKAREQKAEQERKEQEAREAARRAKEQEELKRAQEVAREAAEKERREREQAAKEAAEEAARKAKEAAENGAGKGNTAICNHKAFWEKVEGQHKCSECKKMWWRFVYQCPDCDKLACAECRGKLRGEGQRKGNWRT